MNFFVKIKIIMITIFAISVVILRGGARRNIRELRHGVIVVQNAKLGDMVCTTPVFRAIKKAYPDAYIAVLGNAINEGLIDSNTDVDEYIVSSSPFWDIMKIITDRRFDFGVVATPDALGLALLYLGGVRTVSTPRVMGGYSPQETLPYRFLRIFAHISPHRFGSYAPQEYLRLLMPFGINADDTKKHLAFSDAADKKVGEFLAEQGMIPKRDLLLGISPSAGNKIKEWPAERFATVAAYAIRRYNAKIVVIGGETDGELRDVMIAALPNERKNTIVDTVGRFDLDELKALIAKLDVFIAADTGPIYIAEAFGVSTIDIAGPVDENEQPPRGPQNKIVYLPGRIPQVHIMNSRVYDEKEARRQVEKISVEMVVEKLDELMRKIKTY